MEVSIIRTCDGETQLPVVPSAAKADLHKITSVKRFTSTSCAIAVSTRARDAVLKYCNPEGQHEEFPPPFSEFDQRVRSPASNTILHATNVIPDCQFRDDSVLYPKILHPAFLQFNKYGSKRHRVLPYPRKELHKKPNLLREFCQDSLKASASVARDIGSTSHKRLGGSGILL